tara:strand:- start:25 stop:639 length:615 start_codon:yes stop_codon:yes gene_type:complete
MVFPSVYDMTNESMTTVRKQHFWEYFSGATLNSRWTLTETGTSVMSDSVDGGFELKTGATTSNQSRITFNDIRPFAFDGSVMICDYQRGVTGRIFIGLFEGGYIGSSVDEALYRNRSSATYTDVWTSDGSTETNTVTDIPVHENAETVKLQLSSSNCVVSVNGVIKVTKTTNLPLTKLQPMVLGATLQNAVHTTNIRYCEAYNT